MMSIFLTCAGSSITSESNNAGTVKATNGVSAVGIVHVTVVKGFKTLINIFNVAKIKEDEVKVLPTHCSVSLPLHEAMSSSSLYPL